MRKAKVHSDYILLNTLFVRTTLVCLERWLTNIFKNLEGWYDNYILA